MCKTNTHCSCGHAETSIITLPLDVASTLCVSEKLIWCLVGESGGKTRLHAPPSCKPCRAFSTPRARAPQAPNLTFERISKAKVSSLSLAGSAGHPCGKQLPEPDLGAACLGSRTRRADTSGRRDGGGGWGARQSKAGGGCCGGGGGWICLHMHEHPALPSSQAAALAEAEEEEGGGERKD